MKKIALREFLELFKSVKSILIIAILFTASYYSAKFAQPLVQLLELSGDDARMVHTVGLLFLIVCIGQLFVMVLSHDTVNRELEDRTIRFLLTRVSRFRILAGKWLGIWLFWVTCFTAAYLLSSIYVMQADLFLYLQTICFISFQVSLAVCLSTVISKSGLSLLSGILIGLALPILGFWIATTPAWYGLFKWLNPYYYLLRDDYTFLLILVEAACLFVLSHVFFRRRGC